MPSLDAFTRMSPLQLAATSVLTIVLCISASLATINFLVRRDAAEIRAAKRKHRKEQRSLKAAAQMPVNSKSMDAKTKERDWEFSLAWLSSEFRNVHGFLNSESLAELSLSESVFLRPSAMNILLRRAAKPVNLRYITECARQNTERDLRLQSVTVLQCMAQFEELRDSLLDLDIPAVLCSVLLEETNETALKQALMTLFELIAHRESEQISVVENHRLCQGLNRILTTASSRDLVNWSILLMHNLAVSELTQKQLVAMNTFDFFGKALRLAYGNWTLQKVCFHALVRLLESVPIEQAQIELEKLNKFNIVGLISSSIKIDDTELVHWATGLMHEFCVKDVLRNRFRSERQLLKNLIMLVSPQDVGLSKLVLRIFKFLSIKSPEFQKQIIGLQILPKTVACLSVPNEDTQYWALTLLHDLAPHPESASAILSSPYFGAIIELSASTRNMIPLYILDIIYFLSSSYSSSISEIINSGLCEVAVRFISTPDSEYISNGLSCVLNLCLRGSDIVDKFNDLQIVYNLANVLLGNGTGINDVICAKILCGIGYSRNDKNEEIACSALQNYVLGILLEYSHCAFEALSCAKGDSNVDTDLTQTYWVRRMCRLDPTFVTSVTASSDILQSFSDLDSKSIVVIKLIFKLFIRLDNCLQGVLMFITFPLLMQQFFASHSDVIEIMCDALIDVAILTLSENDKLNEVRKAEKLGDEIRALCIRIASSAISILCGLYAYEKVALYLKAEGFFNSLCVFLGGNDALLKVITISIARCSRFFKRKELLSVFGLIDSLKNLLLFSEDSAVKFSSHSILCQIINPINECNYEDSYKSLTISEATPNLALSPNLREIWNFSYAFESIRTGFGVSVSGKYVYEVELYSDGLIQIGWANSDCVFEYLFGRGIGDNEDSYSCDGFRQRKWHGNIVHYEGEEYGEKWKSGDTVSSVLDLNLGEIVYYLNGVELGKAFQAIDVQKIWYPSISMSSDQGCVVRLGGIFDKLYYQVGDEDVIPYICAAGEINNDLICPNHENTQSNSEDELNSKQSDTKIDTPVTPENKTRVESPDAATSAADVESAFGTFGVCSVEEFTISKDLGNYIEFNIYWESNSSDLRVGWQSAADNAEFIYFSPKNAKINYEFKDKSQAEISDVSENVTKQICSTSAVPIKSLFVTVGIGYASRIVEETLMTYFAFSWQGNCVAIVSAKGLQESFTIPTVLNGRLLSTNVGQQLFELPIISPVSATPTSLNVYN